MFDLKNIGRVTVIGHDLSDVDSLASCLLLNKYLRHFGVSSEIGLFTEPMSGSVDMLKNVGVDFDIRASESKSHEQLFLVDHHKTPYCLPVVGCIDHHPTDAEFDYPVYINQRASSTAFMILKMMQADGVPLTREDYAAAVLSVYSDTQALRSSKLVKDDVPLVLELVKKYGMDEEYLIEAGLGLDDLTKSLDELVYGGFKSFPFEKGLVVSSYLQSDQYEDGFVAKLVQKANEERKKKNAALWVLLLHDPVHGNTVEYDIADEVTVIDHGELISRGSNVMPRIEKLFTEG